MVIILILSLFCSFGLSLAAEDFSADFVSKSSDPKDMPGQGKIFMKGTTMRFEAGGAMTITNPEKGVTWILMPQQKMYMEQAYQPMGRTQQWDDNMSNAAKKVGKETISGIKCTKYEHVSDGHKVYYWISKKIAFPVKVQDDNGHMILKNIKTGNQPDSLFQVPSGYQKFAMPGMGKGMPGMMPGGGGAGTPSGMPANIPGMPSGMKIPSN